MSKKYITDKALSDLSGRAVQTIRNDRFLGQGFPYVKLGRSIRYDLDECIEIMEESKIATSSFSAGRCRR